MKLLTPNIGLIFWTLTVFIVLFFLLKKLAWKPILQAVKERETGIADAIADAQKMKVEMALMKNENEQFLTQTRQEREQLLKEAKEVAIELRWDAKEKAKKECRILVDEALLAIEQEKQAALAQAKKQVNQLALEASEKLLQRTLVDKKEVEAFFE